MFFCGMGLFLESSQTILSSSLQPYPTVVQTSPACSSLGTLLLAPLILLSSRPWFQVLFSLQKHTLFLTPVAPTASACPLTQPCTLNSSHFSFQPYDPRDPTQVFSLGGEHHHSLSHLSNSRKLSSDLQHMHHMVAHTCHPSQFHSSCILLVI